MEISWGAAFFAGISSFASLSVLPLVPLFFLLLTADCTQTKVQRWRRYLLFLFGFGIVFVATGASATSIGQVLLRHHVTAEKLAAVLLFILGLLLSGLWSPVRLHNTKRWQILCKACRDLGAFLLGIAFTIAWIPCTGPTLAAILVYTGQQAFVSKGVILLLCYAMGFSLPFLFLVGLGSIMQKHFVQVLPYLEILRKVSGALLMMFALLLWCGWTMRFLGWLFYFS